MRMLPVSPTSNAILLDIICGSLFKTVVMKLQIHSDIRSELRTFWRTKVVSSINWFALRKKGGWEQFMRT